MVLTDEMKQAIADIEKTTGRNMFDFDGVKEAAEALGHPEIVQYIDEHPQEYFCFIMYGDEIPPGQ